MDEESARDIIMESLEVFINHMLYVRGLYPSKIFKQVKAFNAPVYTSIYPPLTKYISTVLQAARQLYRTKSLRKIELILYKTECTTALENYIFEIIEEKSFTETEMQDNNFITDFEQEIRNALLTTANKVKPLGDVSKETKFRLLLHTTQSAFSKISNNPENHKTYWLQQSRNNLAEKEDTLLLPIVTLNTCGLQITCETY